MIEKGDSARYISLLVSFVILIYHATTVYVCTFLPNDPLYVSVSVTGYAWYGCALALLGIYGSFKRSPTFLTIFSNHLLIDTVLSLVPKIGLIYLFHDLAADLCFGGNLSTSFWLPSTTSPLHGPGHVIQSPSLESPLSASFKARRHCQTGVLIARSLFISLLILWTVAQWALGLGVRRYAVKLEMENAGLIRDNERVDEEKAFYEEESLADGYNDAVKAVQQWSWNEKDSSLFVDEIAKPLCPVFVEHAEKSDVLVEQVEIPLRA